MMKIYADMDEALYYLNHTKLMEVVYLKAYILELLYSDGHIRQLDLKNALTGQLKPLRNVNYFKKAKINNNNLIWQYGEGEYERIELDSLEVYRYSEPYNMGIKPMIGWR